MRYRSLGNTGITVSEIGFGTWGIGGATTDGANSYSATDDAVSLRALEHALDSGITFYDSANIYGYGHAEELLGKAFSKKRDKVVITSKVGFIKHGGPWQLDKQYIRTELEKTLKRLQSDYVDLYQLHSPPFEMIQQQRECVEVLQELKKEGKIRAFGLSVKHPKDGIAAINAFGFDTIQVNFSLIDQRARENGLFDVAEQKKVGIIARTPFCFGFLTDTISNLNFPNDDHRSTWPRAQLERWAQAPKLFAFLREGKGWSAAQTALKFCLAFKVISSVIPGILTPKQAEENASASDLAPLTSAEVKQALQVYKNNVFFDKNTLKK